MFDNGKFKITSSNVRELTAEDINLLSKQSTCSPSVSKSALGLSRKNWDVFYKRNKDNFFKDRHWSRDDLQEACSTLDLTLPLTYLEAGCGVGNMLFPIKEFFPNWDVYGFDFSENAVNIVKEKGITNNVKVNVDVLDLTDSEKTNELVSMFPSADITTLIFVLSAIQPSQHATTVENTMKFVKKGGVVFFRDYGINDHAMIRFGWGTKIDERFYVRSDNTTSYFFTLNEIKSLFVNYGCEVVSCEYLFRKTVNHKKNLSVDRVFVQGVFKKL
uniref:tRNA N(3)-methylcytidine methyltransferase n=1 Tax=Strongyloides venezuelensis TaxID=75913 RepID=A0A0K0F9S1_STRVS